MGNSLIENVISKYRVPDYIIKDQDSAFISWLMNYWFEKLNIKMKTVVPYSHQLLQAEHGIKSLSTILTKHLMDLGQMWSKFLPLATLVYNTFNTLNLSNCSPYELVFSRKPKLILDLETNHDIKVSGTFKDYYTLLNKRLQYIHKLLQDFRSKRYAVINKNRNFFQCNSGDLVYIISSVKDFIQKGSYKISRSFSSLQNYRSSQLFINDIRW